MAISLLGTPREALIEARRGGLDESGAMRPPNRRLPTAAGVIEPLKRRRSADYRALIALE